LTNPKAYKVSDGNGGHLWDKKRINESVIAGAGTYKLIMRTFASGGGADEVFLQINDETQVRLAFNPTASESLWNIWTIQTMHYLSGGSWVEYQFTLPADTHSFVFTGGDPGARLDYFYLQRVDIPDLPPIGITRFMIGTGQTMVISPTTGGCTVIIE